MIWISLLEKDVFLPSFKIISEGLQSTDRATEQFLMLLFSSEIKLS